MRLAIGPSLAGLKQQAEAAIDAAFGQPLDGYAAKVAEARRVLAGRKSPELAAEAALRRVSGKALAKSIMEHNAAAWQVENRRVQAKLTIREAQSEEHVREILKGLGISLPDNSGGPYVL